MINISARVHCSCVMKIIMYSVIIMSLYYVDDMWTTTVPGMQ